MLLIRAFLLWSAISLHVVGGAALFRRLFPRESPWLGFFVPGLALVILLNFIEHFIAMPSLLAVMPITCLACIWALARPGLDWKGFRLPTFIFLGSFAFTLFLRALIPDVYKVPDGVVDLSLMSTFCMGEKVPPPLNWFPLIHLSHYYALGHYAMSVVTRLLGLDNGTGFNLSAALLSAFDALLAAAAAWRIGRQKLWITILAPILLECASNGQTAYLWLTDGKFDPFESTVLLQAADNPDNVHNPLWHWLQHSYWCNRRVLVPPGYWSWMGSFHSTSGGLFLCLLSIYSLAEIFRRRQLSNWPWICFAACPLLLLATSTWGLPLAGLYFLAAAFWIWRYRLRPKSLLFVLLGIGTVASLLAPMLLEFLTTTGMPPGQRPIPDERTQPVEFLVTWWPLIIAWIVLVLAWRRIPAVVKSVLVVSPLALAAMEFYTVGSRTDFTGKLWGYIFGIAWITLIPALCLRRGWIHRSLLALIVLSCLLTVAGWSQWTWDNIVTDDLLHLEGTGTFRLDPVLGGMLPIFSNLRGKTVIVGRADWEYSQSPLLADFSGASSFVSWTYFCDGVEGTDTHGLAGKRGDEVNAIYDGKCTDPLLYLTENDIAALAISPDDKVTAAVLATLKDQLAPYYSYTDLHQDDSQPAGVFIFHPETMKWPREVLWPPAPAHRPKKPASQVK